MNNLCSNAALFKKTNTQNIIKLKYLLNPHTTRQGHKKFFGNYKEQSLHQCLFNLFLHLWLFFLLSKKKKLNSWMLLSPFISQFQSSKCTIVYTPPFSTEPHKNSRFCKTLNKDFLACKRTLVLKFTLYLNGKWLHLQAKEYICVPFFAIFSYNSGCMCIWVVRSAFVRQPAQSMSPTPFCRSQIITLKQSADLYTLLTGMVWPSKNKQFTTILWGINQIFHAIFQKYLILHGGKYKLFCKLILNAIEKFWSL